MKIEDVEKAVSIKELIKDARDILDTLERRTVQKSSVSLTNGSRNCRVHIPTTSLLDHVRAELGELQQQLESL